MELQKFIIEYPPELWYEKRWIIVFLSVILGAFLGWFGQLISGYIKKARLKKEITRNFFMEICTNLTKNRKYQIHVEKLKKKFKEAIDTDYHSGHPSLVFTGMEVTRKFFDLYCSHLMLFEKYLSLKIYAFYQHYLPCIETNAKKIKNQFEKFYKKDPMISADDIFHSLDQHISNIKVLIRSANELLAEMIRENKSLQEVKKEERVNFKKKNQKVDTFLYKLKLKEVFDIDDLSKETNVSAVDAIFKILQNKSIERIGLGKYKKIKNIKK